MYTRSLHPYGFHEHVKTTTRKYWSRLDPFDQEYPCFPPAENLVGPHRTMCEAKLSNDSNTASAVFPENMEFVGAQLALCSWMKRST